MVKGRAFEVQHSSDEVILRASTRDGGINILSSDDMYRLILAGLLLTGAMGCLDDTRHDPTHRPNVLLLLADDMGYSDLACYGGAAATPHLDRLAQMGVRFTNFYAAAPNCSPSRAGLMTGVGPARSGMYNYRPSGHPLHLRAQEETVASLLKEEGYQTAHVGKWHLGCLPQDPALKHPQPKDHGFDYSLGTENNAIPSHLNPINFVRNGEPLDTVRGYSCQILADEVAHWFEQVYDGEDPFFMYVAFHEPHAKVASPPALVDKYDAYDTPDAEYLANIENLDLAVGRILNYLETHQLLDDTWIVFSSDNGSYRQASNEPLRAVKSYLYEGGIRVPGIMRWPGSGGEGQTIDAPAGLVDIMPTLQDMLGRSYDRGAYDGTSMLDVLEGRPLERSKPLYWFFYRTSPEIAVRTGDLMLLGRDRDTVPRTHRFAAEDMAYIKQMQLVDFEWYDLSTDLGQQNNLIYTHPDSIHFKKLVEAQLVDIQRLGPTWSDLPAAEGRKKVKTEWVRY